MKQIESIKEFDGWLNRYQHESDACNCTMTFSVYLPPAAMTQQVPAVYWLSGLTCTDDNVRTKAGAQRYAAELGIALVMPDTSPRGPGVADEPDRYDLGQGAGFYVNATREPWAAHYRMYNYVTKELPALIEAELPVVPGLKSITGHSMGGHGALICALKEEGAYRSVSAFAPICHPTVCGWGKGCFGAYLGDDREAWKASGIRWKTAFTVSPPRASAPAASSLELKASSMGPMEAVTLANSCASERSLMAFQFLCTSSSVGT